MIHPPRPKVSIVVPTIRRTSIGEFLAAWRDEFADHHVIVMEDNAEPSFDLDRDGDYDLTHLSWRDIEAELGEWGWIIPRRTDCVRSFGYLKAVQLGADVIVTLDDDCFPIEPGFIQRHVDAVMGVATEDAWVSTGDGIIPRGVPYQSRGRERPVGINHGLWTNVADYDAITQLTLGRTGGAFEPKQLTIPVGKFFPMCGMNLAWRAELTPAMYFLLMGRDWPFDRFGDIWCGVLAKKVCDHLGYAVTSGAPMIEHRRASNVWTNLAKEAPGLPVNENLWAAVDAIVLREQTVAGCYAQIAAELSLNGDYWSRLRDAMTFWAEITSAALDASRADAARDRLRSDRRCLLHPTPPHLPPLTPRIQPQPQRLPA
jgi:reversibly glycosylated polypeptide / UDP-arabinopyranose mutase